MKITMYMLTTHISCNKTIQTVPILKSNEGKLYG